MLQRRLLPGQFENYHMANHIGLNIGKGVFQGIADPGLGRQMDDRAEFQAANGFLHGAPVRDINLMEGEVGVLQQLPQTVFLQADGIIGAKVIDADDPLALIQEPPGHVKTDETSGTGKQVRHTLNRSKSGLNSRCPCARFDLIPQNRLFDRVTGYSAAHGSERSAGIWRQSGLISN